MANGDSIKAGNITTAYGTTDWVAEQDKDQFSRKPFVGSLIFRVGPTNNDTDAFMPETTWTAFKAREISAVRVWWA